MWENRQTAERDVHIRKVAKVPLEEHELPSGADGYEDYGYSYDQDPPNVPMRDERGKVSTRSQICCSDQSRACECDGFSWCTWEDGYFYDECTGGCRTSSPSPPPSSG